MRKLSTDLIKSGNFTGSFSGSFVGDGSGLTNIQTASYALNTSGATLSTGSTYPITSSWSERTVSSSYSLSSSYADTSISSNYSLSGSFSNNSISSSYSNTSISSSYSLSASYAPIGTTLSTGSTYPITSSWAINAITASYALTSPGGGGSSTFITNSILGQTIYADGNTSSYQLTNTINEELDILVSIDGLLQNYTGSYSISGSIITFPSNINSGSKIDIRYIYLNNGVISSYNLLPVGIIDVQYFVSDGSNLTHSLNRYVNNSNEILLVAGGTVQSPSSSYVASGSILYLTEAFPSSSTFEARFLGVNTSSYLSDLSQSILPASDNTYDLGSPTRQWRDIYVSSGSLYIGNKKVSIVQTNGESSLQFDNKPVLTGISGSLPNTASFALTASYALNASQGGTSLVTGSTYPITSSWSNNNVSSSYALTASFASNSRLVSDTAKASTSGTNIDFTDIPSWVRRITVMFNGVSTNGSSNIQVQIGAGSIATSGYFCNYSAINSGTGQGNVTSGFLVYAGTLASSVSTGHMVLTLISGNTWIASGLILYTNGAGAMYMIAGNVTLSGTLDRLRLTTANGTDTFDAGSINIMYE